MLKPPYQEEPLLDVLGQISFVQDYYKFCSPLAARGDITLTRAIMKAAWLEKGINPGYLGDKVFIYSVKVPGGSVELGTHHSQSMVTLSLNYYKTDLFQSGGDLAVLAAWLLERHGKPLPNPPYPRPFVQNEKQLLEVLTYGLKLQQDVSDALN